jgi:uncharacterized NAD(P)/FAD-binding protein YdhS
MDGNRFGEGARPTTLVIVGAGFSGTALALALLRDPPAGALRIVLIERSGRFGRGLAYAGHWPQALLNVPAGRMSVDERRPNDFCEYLADRGLPSQPEVFAPRAVYGDYLAARLQQAAAQVPGRVELRCLAGTVVDAVRGLADSTWHVRLQEGPSIVVDAVVLAVGHQSPARLPSLHALEGSGLYVADPWAPAAATPPPPQRVLLVGTGLTMADSVCASMAGPTPPREIVAVSRRGLLSRPRPVGVASMAIPPTAVDVRALRRETTTRGLVAALRSQVALAEADGMDWRAVIAAVRDQVPELWHRLDEVERRRFLRHVQPYWDVHRHQLPPAVGQQVQRHVASGSLDVRAARVVASRVAGDQALVTLRERGRATPTEHAFDRVINCSGPDNDPNRATARLVRAMLRSGLLTPCPSGTGIALDAAGRPLGRSGSPAPGFYYLGPWARARDLEATAVQELRAHATALADLLRRPTRDRAPIGPSPRPARAAAAGRSHARPAPG